MTAESIVLLVLLAAALVSFYRHWLRPDLTAILLMLAMMVPWRSGVDGLTPLLTPSEAFSGFGSTAVMMVISMFAISAALLRTGVAENLGRRLFERCAHNEVLLQGAVLTAVAVSSSLLNDTAAVLVWMPVVISFCNQRRLSPSRYLMAVAYGSLLGGMWTLMGTRSNIIVSDLMRQHTGSGLGFFEFTPIALLVFVGCLLFYLTIGLRLLPAASPGETLAEAYQVTEFLTEVMVTPNSSAIGRTLSELGLRVSHGVEVIEIIKGGQPSPAAPWIRVQNGDVLIVQGPGSRIARLLDSAEYGRATELEVSGGTLRSVDLVMAEALVGRNSPLIGRNLREADLAEDYGVSVLAISREGQTVGQRPSNLPLRFGDTLLLCGHAESFDRMRSRRDLLLIDSKPLATPSPRRTALLGAILLLTIVTIATEVLPAPTALAFAAAASLLSGSVRLRELYGLIDWTAVVVLGAMIPYGLALQKTGTANALADWAAAGLGAAPPPVALAALLLFALVCSQFLQKTAVAVILTPIYLELAAELGLSPQPLLLGLALILSGAFMTPIAHESTILVMGPGRYRFEDYVKLGAGFAVICWLLTALALPQLYALTP